MHNSNSINKPISSAKMDPQLEAAVRKFNQAKTHREWANKAVKEFRAKRAK